MSSVCRFARLPVRPFAGLFVNGPTGQRANGPTSFSLIELVIYMAIISIGIVGAMRVFPVGLRASQRAERRSRATIVAQRTLECLKLESWDALVEGESLTCQELPAGQGPAERELFTVTPHIRQPVIEHLVDPTRLKAIEVIVEWTQDNRPRQLSVVTYVRRETS